MRLCRIGDRADSLFLRRKRCCAAGAEELKSEYFRRLKQAFSPCGILPTKVSESPRRRSARRFARRLIAVQRFDKPGEPFECQSKSSVARRPVPPAGGSPSRNSRGRTVCADRIVLRYLDETTMRPVTDTVELPP